MLLIRLSWRLQRQRHVPAVGTDGRLHRQDDAVGDLLDLRVVADHAGGHDRLEFGDILLAALDRDVRLLAIEQRDVRCRQRLHVAALLHRLDEDVGLKVVKEAAELRAQRLAVGRVERLGEVARRSGDEVAGAGELVARLVDRDRPKAGIGRACPRGLEVEAEIEVDADPLEEVALDGQETGLDVDLDSPRLTELAEELRDGPEVLAGLGDDELAVELGDRADGAAVWSSTSRWQRFRG